MLKKIVLFLLLNTVTNIVFAVKPSIQKTSQEKDDSEEKGDNEDDSSSYKDKDENKQKNSKNDEKSNLKKFPSTSLPSIPKGIQNFASDQIDVIVATTPSISDQSVKTEMKQIQSPNEVINAASDSSQKNKKSDLPFSFLNQLPFSVLQKIFHYLNLADQNSLSKTCKKLNNYFKQIDRLHLEDSFITYKNLSVMIRENPFLTHLNLSNMIELKDFCDESIETELKGVKLENLRYLRINGNNNLNFVLALMRIISEGNCDNLTNLEFSRIYSFDNNGIVIRSLIQIIKSKQLSQLSHLILRDNNSDATVVKILADAFHSHSVSLPKLTHLNISNNNFGDKEIKALAQAIQSGDLPNLTHLYISWNKIGDKGIKALVQAIQSVHNSKLTHLDISRNQICEDGFKVLVQAIQSGRLPNLTHLDISCNPFAKKGLIALDSILKSPLFSHINIIR